MAKRQLFKQMAKYTVTTLLGTAADTLVLWVLSTYLLNGNHVEKYVISPMISFECAVLVNYLTAFFYVWRERIAHRTKGAFFSHLWKYNLSCISAFVLKMVLLNNKRLGMVYQWEELFFAGTHANTDMSLNGKYYPDFVTIAKGYGIPATVVTNLKDFRNALRKMLSDKGPFLIDARIIADEQVLPMIPAGGTCEDIITD